jgi:hypothetical protein
MELSKMISSTQFKYKVLSLTSLTEPPQHTSYLSKQNCLFQSCSCFTVSTAIRDDLYLPFDVVVDCRCFVVDVVDDGCRYGIKSKSDR